MNLHRTAIGALCLALFGLMPMPHSAQAQQQGGQEQDSQTFNRFFALINESADQTYAFGQLNAESIRVVNVEDILANLDDTQRQRLRDVYENVEPEELHEVIESSPTILEALRNEAGIQLDARDVVAFEMQDGGRIVAYVDPNGALRGRGMDDAQEQEDEWEDRDMSETGNVQQQDEQQRNRDSLAMGEAQPQDSRGFEGLHSALHDIETHMQALMGANEQRIRVVDVGGILADLDETKIERLRLTYQNAEMDELHSALENEEGIMEALEANSTAQVGMEDVVGVEVRETIVYVDPNNELKGWGMEEAQQREDEWQNRDSSETRDVRQQDPLTFARLHSSMHDMKMQMQGLTRTSDQRIRVVDVGDILADLDDTQIQRLRLTYQDAEMNELHSALENHEAIQSALETETDMQVDVREVIAVDARDEREMIVYIDPNGELRGEGTADVE